MARIPISSFDFKSLLKHIGPGPAITTYDKKQVIFSQGDPADSVFYIQKGKVKITVLSEQGKEAVIAILDANDFLGEGCLAGQPLRLATATTLIASTIVRIAKGTMMSALQRHPPISALFTAHLLRRNSRIEADLVDQLFNSSEKRLARLLLLLANFGKKGKHEEIIPKVSQEMLAEMIGTTRARVSFFMNRFRKLGFIAYNGGLQVHSSLLSVLINDDTPRVPAKIL